MNYRSNLYNEKEISSNDTIHFTMLIDATLKSGFDSPSHFAYTSKKLTGMSAKNIRKDSVFLKVYNLEIE
ncbi:hypothetical protein PMY38_10705 [Clostridium tertium]|jgi:AraC-like DNA-binding protein|uniref:Uncharacterized protein n=2 Tax=Clostridium tertium TaxID=1559 RepID=A0A9X3XNR3_9CLOT|nr:MULTISPECIES: hypothetical protein [Clostridium]EEH97983.1 hypothetical protein CSBG_01609 [Clostridium sp. 7_2_43FAA]MDB1949345.1 hypothetical protein [Clostridium tertium]MDB1954973.1 hypothetical protein [Clostridium tertium]MDB1959069.1 hypothetical protein [Clostridium tertium]MDB1963796.1 hypothetical protein [Clostridium tertium]